MKKSFSNHFETARAIIVAGYERMGMQGNKMLILSILAGAFISFAAAGSNAVIYGIESVGIARILAGAVFPAGLAAVILTGGELFTGNTLMLMSCLPHEGERSKIRVLLKSWLIVYAGNFIGAVLISVLVFYSGQLNFSEGLLGGFTIKTAVYKSNLTLANSFILGVLCNWLVCTAVWIAAGAKDTSGKILGMFFPIMLFVVSGYEHSIANMYYLSAGVMAKANPVFVEQAISLGVDAEKIAALNFGQAALNNLIPVTLGNIAGSCVFTALAYWFVFIRKT